MKKNKTIIIIVFVALVAIVLVVKNLDRFVNWYQWRKSDIGAETRHDETLKKFKTGNKLSSTDISQLVAYYYLTSKEDEGIKLLEEIRAKQDSYMAYFGLSELYVVKANIEKSVEPHREFISKAYNYLSEGFNKVPDKTLAYFMRAKGYAILGCSEPYKDDIKKSLEESKKVKTVMLADGFYVDQTRFAEAVENETKQHKDWQATCLLYEIQRK